MDEKSKGSEKDSSSSAALLELLSPDGYYSYLHVEKPTEVDGKVDEELIKKNYRRLSLKHHPDRPTGDAETFRVLNRAHTVLKSSKLRQQYDLLGLDLDDDDTGDGGSSSSDNGGNTNDSEDQSSNNNNNNDGADGVFGTMASMTLAAILQIIIRTAVMGLTSVLIVRYRITLFPALLFLFYVAYQVRTAAAAAQSPNINVDTLAPLMICIGLVLMYRGLWVGEKAEWSYSFWAGEALVMTMFAFNSITGKRSTLLVMIIFVVSCLLTLWLRGNLWKYLGVLGFEAILAILVALAFPVMEMVLEQILNEKLKKVGEKVRQQDARMRAYYESKKKG